MPSSLFVFLKNMEALTRGSHVCLFGIRGRRRKAIPLGPKQVLLQC